MNYKPVGKHTLAEFEGCPFHILDDKKYLEQTLENVAKEIGATVLFANSYKFDPQGVSVFTMLSESHISIHTYPEEGLAFFDCFTCGEIIDPDKTIPLLKEKLKATGVHKHPTLRRGRS